MQHLVKTKLNSCIRLLADEKVVRAPPLNLANNLIVSLVFYVHRQPRTE